MYENSWMAFTVYTKVTNFSSTHLLNTELDLQGLFGLLCTAVPIGRVLGTTVFPSPRIWAHIRGRYWSAKIDDI
jgi:hypothetical protein